MPFCGVTLRGQKPLPAVYRKELRTLGDHLRKRRLDLGLHQRDVARRIKVNVNTVTNWELNRTSPSLWFVPGIIRFLGHLPFSVDGSLADRLKTYRRIHGLAQKRLATLLGVDPSTLARWERGHSQPRQDLLERVEAVLARPATP